MNIRKIIAIETWWPYYIVLFEDGTIGYSGNPAPSDDGCSFSDWHDIIMLDSSRSHVVGLRKDGCVMTYSPQCYHFRAYKDWQDIIQVVAQYEVTYGLKKDGTILVDRSHNDETFVVYRNNISGARIKCIDNDMHALYENGTLVSFQVNEPKIVSENWKDVITIASTLENTYGLKKDRTVISLYPDEDTNKWKNIISIASGDSHLLGLLSNGRVVAKGANDFNQCNVNTWEDIIKIFAGNYHSAGINSRGKIISNYKS